MIVVKMSDGECQKFSGGHFKLRWLRKYLFIYNGHGRNLAVFKVSQIYGWWEE